MNWMSSVLFFVAYLVGASLAQAQTSPPGYLDEFHYQVSSVTTPFEAQVLMNLETYVQVNNSICADRAEVWTYIMHRDTQAQVGKVFIHFTAKGQASENTQWAYHVAPYVILNGEEVVLDSAFKEFHGHPVKLKDWTMHFGQSEHCVVLDPTHNPQHLAYEKYNMPNDNVTPLTYYKGGARQYPSTEGICYIRKVPMYYAFPKDVYGADLALTGHSEYGKFLIQDFDRDRVMQACRHEVMANCSKYLKLPNSSFALSENQF